MRFNLLKAAAVVSVCLIPAAAHAQTAPITGSLDARINLGTGCAVDGEGTIAGNGGADFGVLDFGDQPANFDEADTTVNGSATGIEIQCSVGTTPILKIGAGQNDGQGTGSNGPRAMKRGTKYIQYKIFQGLPGGTEAGIDFPITLSTSGAVQNVLLSGRAYGAASLDPGEYTDIVSITIEL